MTNKPINRFQNFPRTIRLEKPSTILLIIKGNKKGKPFDFPNCSLCLQRYYSAVGASVTSASAAAATFAASASAFFSATFFAIASFTFFSSARLFS